MYLDISKKLTRNEVFGLYNIREYKMREDFYADAKPCDKVKLFNSKNELRYDIDGLPVFDDKGTRTHDIDIMTKKRIDMKKDKFDNVEHFIPGLSVGSSRETVNNLNIKKTYENNQKINRSMQVEGLTKLFNNVANDVVQKNMASASAAAGAANTINLQGVRCDNIKVRGIDQSNEAVLKLVTEQKQKATSDISTDIVTDISKKITQPPQTDVAAIETANQKEMNDFMNSSVGYDPSSAPQAGGSLCDIGSSSKTTNNTSIDANIKKSLDLDESFKVKDDDDIKNEIKNQISQSNVAQCAANAAAANEINFNDIMCSNLEISDIKQSNAVNVLVTCMFDQEAVNKITTKIQTKITKQIGQIYDAVASGVEKKFCVGQEKEAMKEYFRLGGGLDAISGVHNDNILTAAGLPVTERKDADMKKQDTKQYGPPATGIAPASAPAQASVARDQDIPPAKAPSSPAIPIPSDTSNMLNNPVVLIGIGFFVLLIIILAVRR